MEIGDILVVTCVASVPSGREANSFFGRERIGRAQKKVGGGRGEKALALFSRGRKNEFTSRPLETLATQAILVVEKKSSKKSPKLKFLGIKIWTISANFLNTRRQDICPDVDLFFSKSLLRKRAGRFFHPECVSMKWIFK